MGKAVTKGMWRVSEHCVWCACTSLYGIHPGSKSNPGPLLNQSWLGPVKEGCLYPLIIGPLNNIPLSKVKGSSGNRGIQLEEYKTWGHRWATLLQLEHWKLHLPEKLCAPGLLPECPLLFWQRMGSHLAAYHLPSYVCLIRCGICELLTEESRETYLLWVSLGTK